jgi:hypothetical protein
MREAATGINWIAALVVGGLVFVVCRRVLKACPMLDNAVVAFCVAALTTLSFVGNRKLGVLLIPYAALGLSLLFLFLILPFVKDKQLKKEKPMRPTAPPPRRTEDPWEKKLRRRQRTVTRRLIR